MLEGVFIFSCPSQFLQASIDDASMDKLIHTFVCLHLIQVKAVAEELGIGFLGIGFQPKWGVKDIPMMPKV